MRVIEILALGPELRREAEQQCAGVNEAHFVVHQVLSRAFADGVEAPALHDELSSRVRHKVIENSIGRCGSVSASFATLLRLVR
jgi:hypothetical protein